MRKNCTLSFSLSQNIGLSGFLKSAYFYPILALVFLLLLFSHEYRRCLSANTVSFSGKPASAISEIGPVHSGDLCGSCECIQKIV